MISVTPIFQFVARLLRLDKRMTSNGKKVYGHLMMLGR